MEIAGLPLHPLVIHAVIGLVPLSALFGVALALVPGWRWLTRWPAAALAVAAAVLTWVARLSGKALLEARPFLLDAEPLKARIERHEELGELLSLAVVPYALVVVLAAWSLAGTSPLASGRGARRSRVPALEQALPVVLVLAALGMIVLVTLTGDAGARAVWG